MNDSTSVDLYVLRKHEEFIRELYVDYDPYEDHYFNPNDDLITQFSFEEINYGELHDLGLLEEQGIPYTVEWGKGDEYSQGSQSLRFDSKGNKIKISYYEDELSIQFLELVKIIKSSHPLDIIKEKVDEMQRISTPLPWEDQEQNAKIYLTRKLIGANNECDSTESPR